ncbi:MAG: hypothetical protein WAT39_02990 [Planctomycetota bacterium]
MLPHRTDQFLGLASLALVAAAHAQDAPRTAAQILRDFDRVAMPSFSDGSDSESVKRFKAAIEKGCRQKAEFAAELQRKHPDHERLPEVLSIRWAGMTNALGMADDVAKELATLLQADKLRADVKREAVQARARAMLVSKSFDNLARLDAVSAVLEDREGDDGHAASLLLDFVEDHVVDPETQRTLLGIAIDRWPDDPYGGRPAKRWLALVDRIGKPFVEQLPAEHRAWFGETTTGDAEFTIVQVWMGWVNDRDGDGKDPELAALQQLRQDLGDRVRVLGLVDGKLEERRPAMQQAGVDWPQHEFTDQEPMRTPFGAPRVGFYFVLDQKLQVAGVVGRAASLRERIDQLRAQAAR